MRLYCNITGVPDVQEDQVGLNVPIRCAGITDLDPDQFYYEEDTSTDTESKDKPEKKIKIDYKPHEDNILEGKNHALKLVDSINTSDFARLFVAKFKTLEYDLAMESNNAKEMAKVLIELWPSKTGDVKNGLQVIIDDDYSEITSEQKANHAFEILKRVDDKNIGKGYFAQVLADKISSEEIKLQVPQYLEDAILWACSVDKSSIEA